MENIDQQPIKLRVGKRLRDLRKRAGFSSAGALAAHIGVQTNTVGDIERGDNWISPEMLPILSKALDVPPAAFFPGAGDPIAPTPQEAIDVLNRFIASAEIAKPLSAVERETLDTLSALEKAKRPDLLRAATEFLLQLRDLSREAPASEEDEETG